jgi:hypothetical protein
MIISQNRLPGAVPALVRAWTRLYCAGISEQARMIRHIEIDSDLWEHYTDRLAQGADPATIGVEAFSRMLRGVPSDIAWRVQAEGFHVNINFPVERIAGVLLLLLVIPFVAGGAISGYDTSPESWPGEFDRFGNMSSTSRDMTAAAHGIIGVLMIAGVGILFATVRDRSPKLITMACVLLAAAGTIMLVNAALYRTMSELASEYSRTSNVALISNARAFALTIEGLAVMNTTATTAGILSLAIALSRLGMVPRWTLVLPVIGAAAPVMLLGLSSALPDSTWWYIMVSFIAVAFWLLIAGFWLLFGGSRGALTAPSTVEVPA